MKRKLSAAGAVLVCHSLVAGAQQVALDKDYLVGKWSLDGVQACSSDTLSYVLFRNNGTSEFGQRGRVDMVGFWSIHDGSIIAHSLTAPTAHEQYHPFFRQSYNYEYFTARVTDRKKGEFTAQTGTGGDSNTYQLTRCP